MPSKKNLLKFLKSDTKFENLGDEKAIIGNEIFGQAVGESIRNNSMIEFAKELGAELLNMDIYKASIVSNFIGFVCEKTENSEIGEEVILLLKKSCELVKEFFEINQDTDGNMFIPDDMKKVYNKNSQCVKAYYGFNTLCISAMAFLSRNFKYRKLLRSFNIKETLDILTYDTPESEYLKSIYYVNQIHDTCSKMPLLVLDTEKQQGFIAQVNDINNCFHLIYLLEEEIYKNLCEKYGMEGYELDKELSVLAHGEYPDCGNKAKTMFFVECNFHQIKSNDTINLIWGEMPPECIPFIDGYHIIALQRKGIQRSFNAGFLVSGHTALKPYLKVERELSDEEYNNWITKIKNL